MSLLVHIPTQKTPKMHHVAGSGPLGTILSEISLGDLGQNKNHTKNSSRCPMNIGTLESLMRIVLVKVFTKSLNLDDI
jgi:hypothetical protein